MMEAAWDALAEEPRLVSGGGRHVEKGRGASEGPGRIWGGCRACVCGSWAWTWRVKGAGVWDSGALRGRQLAWWPGRTTAWARAVGSANAGEHVGRAGRAEAQQWHRQDKGTRDARHGRGMDDLHGWG